MNIYLCYSRISTPSANLIIDRFLRSDFPLPSWRHEARSVNGFHWLSKINDQSNVKSEKN